MSSMNQPTDCMIQKARSRPRAGMAFLAKASTSASKSRARAKSLMAVRASPRGSSAEAKTCAKVRMTAVPIQNLVLVRKRTSSYLV